MPETKSKTHDKAYVLVEARKLLFPKQSKRLKQKVRELALSKKKNLTPF